MQECRFILAVSSGWPQLLVVNQPKRLTSCGPVSFVPQAGREHERLRGRLRPLQEDLQRGLLQAGPDLQDAREMDRHREFS